MLGMKKKKKKKKKVNTFLIFVGWFYSKQACLGLFYAEW